MTSASLAGIFSGQEQNELSSSIFNEKEAWIGLNDISKEGFYVWADGSPLVYVNWSTGEAEAKLSLQEERDCVAATKSSWQTRRCSETKASVCFVPAILSMF